MRERPGFRAVSVDERLRALGLVEDPKRGGATSRRRHPLIWKETLEDGAEAVCKLYPHRGPVSWEREKRFRFRVEREYRGLRRLAAHGVPCPEPLFWTYGRHAQLGRYEVLATRQIVGAEPLSSWIDAAGARRPLPPLAPLLAHVRRMHEAGVFHGALWIKNILVAPRSDTTVDFFLLDMPKAMLFPGSIVGTRMAAVDLLDLFWWIADAHGVEACRPLMTAYGLDERATEALLRRVRRYRPTRFTRNRQRFEFSVRELLARRRAEPSKTR